MAIAWANVEKVYRGPRQFVYAEATMDNSYASGGEAVVPADVGLSEIHMAIITAEAGWAVSYSKTSPTAGLFLVYPSSTPSTNSAVSAPLASSVGRDLSAVTFTVLFVGR